MGNWVYRRPFRRVVRPKIPLTRGHGLLIAAFTRRRVVVRRRAFVRPRMVFVFGRAAQAGQVVIRPRVRIRGLRIRRAPRRLGPVFHVTVVVNNVTGPVIRFRRAVARMHRALRARLRWRPRLEEIPPLLPPTIVFQSPKGRVTSAGAVRGRIIGGGD